MKKVYFFGKIEKISIAVLVLYFCLFVCIIDVFIFCFVFCFSSSATIVNHHRILTMTLLDIQVFVTQKNDLPSVSEG